MFINKDFRDKIIKAIESNTIPDEDFDFREDFGYSGGIYVANGTLKYKDCVYSFLWNHDEGIIYSTIDSDITVLEV